MVKPLFATRESKVEKRFTTGVRALRGLLTKAKLTGWPDQTVAWFDGIVDFVELKRPKGGVFSVAQQRTHAKLAQRGHNVFCLFTVEQVDDYLEMRRPHGRAVGEKI